MSLFFFKAIPIILLGTYYDENSNFSPLWFFAIDLHTRSNLADFKIQNKTTSLPVLKKQKTYPPVKATAIFPSSSIKFLKDWFTFRFHYFSIYKNLLPSQSQ